MPSDRSNVNRRANKEGWEKRQRGGVRGKAYEFHISSLPQATRKELGEFDASVTEGLDIDTLAKIIEAVEILLDSGSKKLPPATKAKVIAILYKASKSNKYIDLELIKNTLDLVA